MTLDEIEKALAMMQSLDWEPCDFDYGEGLCDVDADFFAKSPKYVDWLIADNKRLEEGLGKAMAVLKMVRHHALENDLDETSHLLEEPDCFEAAKVFLQSLTPKPKEEKTN